MPNNGAHLKFNVILLIGLTAILNNRIATAEFENLHQQRYDYIDVAKETASGRSKGQTTRIFTTGDELDEAFWLKYLGEEFRHAVHLQVDDENNVVPIERKITPSQQFRSNNIEPKEDKRTRFVRQPAKNNKQIPVESLLKRNDNQYPTEKPETFKENPVINPLHNTKQPHLYNNTKNNKKILKNKQKLLIHNEHKQKIIRVKPSSPLKAIHEPIVVNLPETEEADHQINEEQVPVVVQMPPVIYHQKADLYPGQRQNIPFNRQKVNLRVYNGQTQNVPSNNQKPNLFNEQISSTDLNRQHQNTQSYTKQTHYAHQHSNVHDIVQQPQQEKHPPQTDYIIHSPNQQQPYPYQTLPLSSISLTQLPFAPAPSR